MNLVINFIGFQLGWFACVLGGAAGKPLLAVCAVVFILVVHLYRSNNIFAELCIIFTAMAIGFVWESLVISTDWLTYPLSSEVSNYAPIWLVAMWALFASTMNVSMAWLKKRWLLASVMGAVFGPLAFVAGEKLGAVIFLERWYALLALALGWTVLMPLLLWLADSFQRRYQFMEKI